MQQYFRPQINTFTDKANFVLYGAAGAALCVGVEYATNMPKLVMGAAFVAAAAFNYFHTVGANYILDRNFPPTPEKKLPAGSEDLPNMMTGVSEKLDVSLPHLHVIEERKDNWLSEKNGIFLEDDVRPFTKDDIRSYRELEAAALLRINANAMTYGTKKTGVIVQASL
ncbi:MAG: hypothetical protein KGI37_00690 [Alphaproteobacteria bacterium]|nr:hypothetical protein [Alphaproteobacteria bacterium]